MYICLQLLSNLLIIICSLTVLPVNAQKNIRLASPDGAIVFSFGLRSSKMEYSISYKGKLIVNKSSLDLAFTDNAFSGGKQINKPVYGEATESYELIVGKSKAVNDHYKEVVIPVQENSVQRRQINLVVRAFNDGIAFRYEFPKQQNWSSYELKDEHTTFTVAGDPAVRALLLPNYTTSHEGLYTSLPLSNITEDTLIDMPALFEFPGPVYMAITEAALVDYAGMYLAKQNGVLVSKISPLTNQSHNPPSGDGGIKVKATLPHKTPWRVMLISDRVGALIESNIITSLNEPNKITDVSWIKPGKTTFPWWNGSIIPDTTFAPGNNFENNQYYIDFCARNGLEYHSVVESCGHEWYTNDGGGYQPGPGADVTKPVPGIDMQQICDYAKTKNVDIRVWVHWKALYPKLDTAFATFQRWGLSGMMIDFMDRDDQEMVNIQTEMLEKAAKHHLHIQFHGAYKPTGLHRTYPNEFTREGTLNYEVNKWDKIMNADHDINMPFTRMLAGSTDYHMGGFRAVPDSLFKVQYTRPLMLSTRCHMLAMYVVLEGYLGMVCDYPAAYEGQPGFEFIKHVPVVWDKTKVLDAVVGQYIIIARKKNNNWYIGGITNHSARELVIPFNFLDAGNYEAEIYTDAKDVKINPNNVIKEIKSITNAGNITVQLAGGGGVAIIIKKK